MKQKRKSTKWSKTIAKEIAEKKLKEAMRKAHEWDIPNDPRID